MSYESLRGKTYIVTGAASGMGRAISLMLARQGANVGMVDLNKPDDVLAEIEKFGGKAVSLAADVQQASAVDSAFKAVVDKFGQLDGAANMAGTVGNLRLGEKKLAMEVLKDEDWNFLLGTNLDGVKNSVRAELQLFKGPGSIVNAASVSGQLACPLNSPYGAAKFGVIGITKSVAQEVASKGIRINAVAPGYVRSGLTKALGDEEFLFENVVKQKVAMQRFGEPEDIANVVLFLLSDQSGYMTGSVVNVDGGWY